MSGVLGAADKHIDVRRFLEEHSCRKGSAVLFIAPLLEAVVVLEVVFGILEYAVDGDDALGNEICRFRSLCLSKAAQSSLKRRNRAYSPPVC